METVVIPVLFKGRQMDFTAVVVKMGYVYKIKVDVHGIIIIFEQDDEYNWRGSADTLSPGYDAVNKELVAAIGAVLGSVGT